MIRMATSARKRLLPIIIAVFFMLVGNALRGVHRDITSEKSIAILTIGNSFARNACFFLSQMTESVPGHKIDITRANIGGCSLQKHAELIEACEEDSTLKPYYDQFTLKELLQKRTYDYVTIQQVSRKSFRCDSYQPFADKLVAFVRVHAPEAEVIIHQTWAYHPESSRLREWNITRAEMHEGLVDCYARLSEHLDVDIVPSGNAFYRAYEERSDINLWAEDGYHANENGKYLAACVWFGSLFDTSPQLVKFVPAGLDLREALFLQSVADQVLLHELTKTK